MFQEFFTSEGLLSFDMAIYKFSETLWSPIMDKIMIFITHLGDEGIFWIALGVVLLLFKKTRKLGIAALGGLALVSFMNSIVLKDLFERLRPYAMDAGYWERVATDGWHYQFPFADLYEKSFAFPSGHTASSFGAAIGIFYIDKKKGIAPLILAFLIGFSRIYIHVHYPSDVIAGMIVGIVFGLLACLIIFKLFGGILDKLNEKSKYRLFPVAEEAGAVSEKPKAKSKAKTDDDLGSRLLSSVESFEKELNDDEPEPFESDDSLPPAEKLIDDE